MRLATGEYDGQYKLRVQLDGASLTGDRFTIVRGDAKALTISLTPNRLGPPGRAVSAPSNDESVAVADVIQGDIALAPARESKPSVMMPATMRVGRIQVLEF